MFTATFWKLAAERAIKTAAQTLLLTIGAAQGADLFQLDWATAAAGAAAGLVLSLLTSIVSAPFGDTGTPSLVTIPDSMTTAPALSNGSEQPPVV
jgi:hypothetical protein